MNRIRLLTVGRSAVGGLRSILAATALCTASLAIAAPAPWPAASFQYFAKQFPMSKVFGDFAGAFGLKLVISPQVDGKLNGDYTANTPTQFLDTVTAAYGLTWYYQGGVLYIDKASETMSRTLRVSRSDVASLKQALTSLGIFDARFGWAEFAERGVIVMSGPPSYVNLVTKTIDDLGMGPGGGEEMRVFPLRHARAEDRSFAFRDQQVNTPGVASILRSLLSDSGGSSRLGTTTLTTSTAMTVGASAGRRGEADAASMDKAGAGGDKAGTGAMGPAPSGGRRAVIQAEQVQHGGVQIVHLHATFYGLVTKVIGRAVDCPTFCAAAGQPHAES